MSQSQSNSAPACDTSREQVDMLATSTSLWSVYVFEQRRPLTLPRCFDIPEEQRNDHGSLFRRCEVAQRFTCAVGSLSLSGRVNSLFIVAPLLGAEAIQFNGKHRWETAMSVAFPQTARQG
jgi:hypothetical protein